MSESATAALEAYASMESAKHKPEQGGGCTCGFCVWSIEHVVVMSIRDAWPLAEYDRRLGDSPVIQQLVALDRAGELAYTEVPGDREPVERAMREGAVDPAATAQAETPSCNRPNCDCGDAEARRALLPHKGLVYQARNGSWYHRCDACETIHGGWKAEGDARAYAREHDCQEVDGD